MEFIIDIRRSTVDKMDLSSMSAFVAWHPDAKYFQADREHYRLLAFLAREVSRMFPGSPILDIGSHLGHSAAALRAGADVQTSPVFTFDHGARFAKALPPEARAMADACNIEVQPPTREALDDIPDFVTRRGCMLVALDTEPHDGVYERAVIQSLMDTGFKGILVLDETRLNQNMQDLFKWAPVKKIDVSQVAHWSGTAVLVFDPATLDCVFNEAI